MNYETEPWYKLYIRESTEDKVLPVLNRSFRDFLLRFAKSRNDGTILAKSSNPGEDIARALGAHPTEFASIVGFVASMLEDGYLNHRKGRLSITNFVAAQEARSAGARRQKVYRDKHNSSRIGIAPSDVNVAKRDVTVASHVTSQEIRSDPKRDEERRDDENARARGRLGVVGSVPEVPEPEADPGRETICPLDLLRRDGVKMALRELAEKLPCPLSVLESEAAEFVSYWTIGEGMGGKRTNWPRTLRERLRKRFFAGELKAPGAVEHERHSSRRRNATDPSERVVSPATAAAIGPELMRLARLDR